MGGSFFAQHGPHRKATPPSHGLARVHALHFRAAGAQSYNRERGSPVASFPGLPANVRVVSGVVVRMRTVVRIRNDTTITPLTMLTLAGRPGNEASSPAYLPTIPVLLGLSRRLRDNPGIPVLRAKIPVFSRGAVPR